MDDFGFYASFTAALVGIACVSYFGAFFDVPKSHVGSLNSLSLEKRVRVSGVISRVHRFKGGSIMMELTEDSDNIDVFIPFSTAQQLGAPLVVGAGLSVAGTLQLYEGRLELVVDQVSDLDER